MKFPKESQELDVIETGLFMAFRGRVGSGVKPESPLGLAFVFQESGKEIPNAVEKAHRSTLGML